MAKCVKQDVVLSMSDLVDLELRIRGSSLQLWAGQHGLTTLDLVAMLEGLRREVPEVRHALEETLGCSTRRMAEVLA